MPLPTLDGSSLGVLPTKIWLKKQMPQDPVGAGLLLAPCPRPIPLLHLCSAMPLPSRPPLRSSRLPCAAQRAANRQLSGAASRPVSSNAHPASGLHMSLVHDNPLSCQPRRAPRSEQIKSLKIPSSRPVEELPLRSGSSLQAADAMPMLITMNP